MTDHDLRAALAAAHAHRTEELERLGEWLRIPSVSTDSATRRDVRRAADWLVDRLRKGAFERVELHPPDSHPIVYAEAPAADPAAPTVLVYGHYDVQPAGDEADWESPPFEPTVRGEELYARGSCDMKGPTWSVLAALAALRRSGVELPVTVKLLVEGQEEIGSPALSGFLERHAERLRCDFCLNPDAGMLGAEMPTLATGVRGIAFFDLEVSGPIQELHSGEFGGVVHNPAQVLCELLAGLHDDRGRVTLPGFYESVVETTADEREALRRLPLDEDFYRSEAQVPELWGEQGYSVQERIGTRPTLEIHGLLSGYTGAGAKSIVPARATAKLSTRLVPDQDPAAVRTRLEGYLEVNAPPTVTWKLTELQHCAAATSDPESPWSRAMEGALERAWGCRPLRRRIGGTVPIVVLARELLGVECVNTGWALLDGNAHAPNERLHLPTLHRGIEALIRFFHDLPDVRDRVSGHTVKGTAAETAETACAPEAAP